MRARLEKSYKLAVTSSTKAKERQKRYYDLKTRGAIIQPGDRVLVKIVAYEGKHKIKDKWEEEPYIVQSRPNQDIPVYIVRKENGEGRTRTLHRNLLLPIGHLDCFTPPKEQHQTPQKEQQKSSHEQRPVKPIRVTRGSNSLPRIVDADSDSDDSVEMTVQIIETHNQPATVTGEQNTIAAASEVDDNRAGDDQPSVASTQETEDSGDAHSLDTGSASASVHADGDDHEEGDIEEGTADQGDHDDHQDVRVDPEDHEIEGQHGQIDHEGSQGKQPARIDTESHDQGDDESRDDDGGSTVEEEQPQTRTSRRTQRPRKKPRWMQTGEFAMQQQTIGYSDWRDRADYLANLAKSGVLERMDSSVSSALISFVLGTQK